ncbi:MAG: ribonuclease HII [Spirochaetaceae bacterium]|nr:MAG: ribonuclease HII [Spirochaetaceae bacterium]
MVCGIDEAGRGPLAGPVTAAAVVLPRGFPFHVLADSKVLSAAKREAAATVIRENAVAWSVAWAWPREIDEINIHHATLLAMARCHNRLLMRVRMSGVPNAVTRVLVDGKFVPAVESPCEAIVRGDSLIPEISAASILAKTARDRWMTEYAAHDPRYGFEKHKGYPTSAHREAVRQHGLCIIHRVTFCRGLENTPT